MQFDHEVVGDVTARPRGQALSNQVTHATRCLVLLIAPDELAQVLAGVPVVTGLDATVDVVT